MTPLDRSSARRYDAGGSVYLREIVEDDVSDEYLSWFKDTIVTKFLEVRNLTRQDALDYIVSGRESGSHHMFALCVRENDRHIGNVKLGPIDTKNGIADLVTVIGDRNYWGKGLATEAVKIANKVAFEEFGLRKLSGGVYSSNVGPVKAYLRAGWVVEGRLVGHRKCDDGTVEDEILISCFNPACFDLVENRPAGQSAEM